jgi:hypothetical protein
MKPYKKVALIETANLIIYGHGRAVIRSWALERRRGGYRGRGYYVAINGLVVTLHLSRFIRILTYVILSGGPSFGYALINAFSNNTQSLLVSSSSSICHRSASPAKHPSTPSAIQGPSLRLPYFRAITRTVLMNCSHSAPSRL